MVKIFTYRGITMSRTRLALSPISPFGKALESAAKAATSVLKTSYVERYAINRQLENYATTINLVEVGPRDGLQSETTFVPTEAKLELLRNLAMAHKASGKTRAIIEAGSSVNPKVIPQLADFEALIAGIQADQELQNIPFSWLALNLKGVEKILERMEGSPNLGSIGMVISPSQQFTERNMGAKSLDEMKKRLSPMMSLALGKNVPVLGYVSTVFHCPFQGYVKAEKSADCAKFLHENGAQEIALGDTTGHGTPAQVQEVLTKILKKGVPAEKLQAHFHDTFGTALENTLAAVEMGITTVHSSVGGLGGCPYAKSSTPNGRAPGNLATEDAIFGLRAKGYVVNADLQTILDAAQEICGRTFGREVKSNTYQYLMGMPEHQRTEVIRRNEDTARLMYPGHAIN